MVNKEFTNYKNVVQVVFLSILPKQG